MAKNFEPRPFGKYFLTDRIAVGGMAEIYKAKTFGVDGFEKTLAIKKILSNYSLDKDFVTMLTDEAKLVVNLSHPNIVQVYDLGRVVDDYFISMEYINGVNLRELVSRGQELGEKIPFDIAIHVALEVCKGLDYAHSKLGPDGQHLEIVHRDISPHNVLVSFDGDVKIVDFGIAKAAQNVSQTNLGILKGKVTYMSPEQALGKPIDARTDQFSLGIILYELITGERLFNGETQIEVLEKIRKTKITKKTLSDKIPKEVRSILATALSYHAKDRFKTAADMQIELTRLLYSSYSDFTPRRLSELLQRWFGEHAKRESSLTKFSPQQMDRLTEKHDDLQQVTIVHRPETGGTKMSDDTLGAGQWHPSDFERSDTKKAVSYSKQVSASPRKKSFSFLWLFLLLLVGGGIAFYYFSKSSPEPVVDIIPEDSEETIEEPLPQEVVEMVFIEVKSEPDGAAIFLDGQETKLTTPAEVEGIKLQQEYALVLKKEGYKELKKTILLESVEDETLFSFQLEKLLPQNYSLMIRSEPVGAQIYVDGVDKKLVTPAEIKELALKQDYKILLKKEGYQDFEQLFINESQNSQELEIRLKPVPMASVKINSVPSEAKIFVNDKDTGFNTPYEFQDLLAPQKLKITLKKDGFSDFSQEVLVSKAEKLADLNFTLKKIVVPSVVQPPKKDVVVLPSEPVVKTKKTPQEETQTNQVLSGEVKLRIDSSPSGASVTINGVGRGITPMILREFARGSKVTVVVSKKGYQSWSRTVTLNKAYVEISATLSH